jgi:hypothetical protein
VVKEYLGPNHSGSVWMETTQDDGKPLFIQLKEDKTKIYLIFNKTKEGLWAEGPAQLCKESASIVHAKIDKAHIKLGESLPKIIRWGFSAFGADFKLKPTGSEKQPTLEISTSGWSGSFVPSDEKAFKEASGH